MFVNIRGGKIILFVPGRCLLQAGWQISFSPQVSSVGPVALLCGLLTVATFSGLSPARVVTTFVLLLVSQYVFLLFFQLCNLPLVFIY
jgi:hypothetical protein